MEGTYSKGRTVHRGLTLEIAPEEVASLRFVIREQLAGDAELLQEVLDGHADESHRMCVARRVAFLGRVSTELAAAS